RQVFHARFHLLHGYVHRAGNVTGREFRGRAHVKCLRRRTVAKLFAEASSLDGCSHSFPLLWEEGKSEEKDSGGRNFYGWLLLVDHLARADGVIHFGEVANVGGGIAVEHDQISGVTVDHSAGPPGFEESRGRGGERCKDVAKVHSCADHVLILAAGVVELGVAHVGAEENGTALREVALELGDGTIEHIGLDSLASAILAHLVGKQRQRGNERRMLLLHALQLHRRPVIFHWNRVRQHVHSTSQRIVGAGVV